MVQDINLMGTPFPNMKVSRENKGTNKSEDSQKLLLCIHSCPKHQSSEANMIYVVFSIALIFLGLSCSFKEKNKNIIRPLFTHAICFLRKALLWIDIESVKR